MRFKVRKGLGLNVAMDMTPLIDVVFLQLIFFMLTSAFVYQTGVKVHLPRSVTSEVAQQERLTLTIAKDGLLYRDSHPVTLQELKGWLKGLEQKHPAILIQADRQAPMGRVVEVWDLCRLLGISQVNIATDPSTRALTQSKEGSHS